MAHLWERSGWDALLAALIDQSRKCIEAESRVDVHTVDISDDSRDRRRSGFEATPILVDGTLYFITDFNRVIALDPETGRQRWAYDPKIDLTLDYESEKICQCAIQVPTRSGKHQQRLADAIPTVDSAVAALQAEFRIFVAKHLVCEVHSQCAVCRRCMVSAVPSSPDCTTKASGPAVRHKRNRGSRGFSPKREVTALHGNKSGFGLRISNLEV